MLVTFDRGVRPFTYTRNMAWVLERVSVHLEWGLKTHVVPSFGAHAVLPALSAAG